MGSFIKIKMFINRCTFLGCVCIDVPGMTRGYRGRGGPTLRMVISVASASTHENGAIGVYKCT